MGGWCKGASRGGGVGVGGTVEGTVFDLISEHALISGHPPFIIIIIFLFFLF